MTGYWCLHFGALVGVYFYRQYAAAVLPAKEQGQVDLPDCLAGLGY